MWPDLSVPKVDGAALVTAKADGPKGSLREMLNEPDRHPARRERPFLEPRFLFLDTDGSPQDRLFEIDIEKSRLKCRLSIRPSRGLHPCLCFLTFLGSILWLPCGDRITP